MLLQVLVSQNVRLNQTVVTNLSRGIFVVFIGLNSSFSDRQTSTHCFKQILYFNCGAGSLFLSLSCCWQSVTVTGNVSSSSKHPQSGTALDFTVLEATQEKCCKQSIFVRDSPSCRASARCQLVK